MSPTIQQRLFQVGEALWGDDWRGKMAQHFHMSTATLEGIVEGRTHFHDEARALGDLLRLVQTEVNMAIESRENTRKYLHERSMRVMDLQTLAHKLSEAKV